MTIDFRAEVDKRKDALMEDLFGLLRINSERDDSKNIWFYIVMCQNTAPHLHPPDFPIGAYDTKLHFSVIFSISIISVLLGKLYCFGI